MFCIPSDQAVHIWKGHLHGTFLVSPSVPMLFIFRHAVVLHASFTCAPSASSRVEPWSQSCRMSHGIKYYHMINDREGLYVLSHNSETTEKIGAENVMILSMF